jgi:hypothetical protein
MDSIEKAQALIRKAPSDRENFDKYAKALSALSDLERKRGDKVSSEFIKNELMEALLVATQ